MTDRAPQGWVWSFKKVTVTKPPGSWNDTFFKRSQTCRIQIRGDRSPHRKTRLCPTDANPHVLPSQGC